jgi:magnesium chelatase subunit I
LNDETVPNNVLPYSSVIGQDQLKLALELSFIEPRISGVLVSGERGSGKSTAVRAFARMTTGKLPVTLPINATEDRVVGGWDVGQLLESVPQWKDGLLEEADRKGMLYVDEVNLLDDHIVNIILDVTASGLLTVERDSESRINKPVKFTLVGTMNPEEGMLRPQLLDRFGLMVDVEGLTKASERRAVLETVLNAANPAKRQRAFKKDDEIAVQLKVSQGKAAEIDHDAIIAKCVELSGKFEADGSRGELTLALAACALAAKEGAEAATVEHLRTIAPLALQHRRKAEGQRESSKWGEADKAKVDEVLGPKKS